MKILRFSIIGLMMAVAAHGQQVSDTKALLPVRDFISVSFDHGVPFDIARQYGKQDVDKLITLLRDDEMKPYWGNIIWVLGAIGDDKGFREIVKFSTQRFTKEVDAHVFAALIQCNLALGPLANQSDKAFEFLRQASTETFWQDKQLAWSYQTLKVPGHREILMTQLAINALGLTGRPEAIDFLSVLKKQQVDDRSKRFFANNISEALDNAQRSSKVGLESVLTTSDYDVE